MKDPFSNTRLRLDRARQRIDEFARASYEFIHDARNYEYVQIEGPDNRIQIKLRFTRGIPDEFTMLTIEASEHLRAALDHATHAAAIASGRTNAKWTGFPFSRDFDGINKAFKNKSKHLPPAIRELVLKKFRPYKDGDDLLWSLDEIARVSKHRRVTPIALAFGSRTTLMLGDAQYAEGANFDPEWDADQNELLLASFPAGIRNSEAWVTQNIEFGFSHTEAVRGRIARDVLADLHDKVNAIIGEIQAEAGKWAPPSPTVDRSSTDPANETHPRAVWTDATFRFPPGEMKHDPEPSKVHAAFEDAWMRMGRSAKPHRELIGKIDEYLRCTPQHLLKRVESDGAITLALQLQPIPQEIDLLVVEVAEHLQAALDQAAYSMAECAGKLVNNSGGNDPRDSYFPFGETEQDARDTWTSRSKDLPKEIHDKFLSFKPYKEDGDALLYALYDFVRVSKHRCVTRPVVTVFGTEYQWTIPPEFPNQLAKPRWYPEHNMVLLGLFPKGVPVDSLDACRPGLNLALNGIESVRGMPLSDVFCRQGYTVRAILKAAQEEALRIGLIK